MVKGEMHLQGNTLFDLWVKVTKNIAQIPLHYVISAPAKFAVATYNGLGEDAFTRNLTEGRTHCKRRINFGTK